MTESKSLEEYQEEIKEKKKTIHEKLIEHQNEIKKLYLEKEEEDMKEKALRNFEKNTPSPITQTLPSQQKRRQFEAIPGSIKSLVAQKVLYEGCMSYEKAAAIYGISKASVQPK